MMAFEIRLWYQKIFWEVIFEYMDLTIDSDGKLWLLTDASDLYQFTSSGKLKEKNPY